MAWKFKIKGIYLSREDLLGNKDLVFEISTSEAEDFNWFSYSIFHSKPCAKTLLDKVKNVNRIKRNFILWSILQK